MHNLFCFIHRIRPAGLLAPAPGPGATKSELSRLKIEEFLEFSFLFNFNKIIDYFYIFIII